MRVRTKATCVECNREFDLLDEEDANEWHYGHDCEADGPMDDEWINAAYMAQAGPNPAHGGHYDGGRLVR